jgi:hypothetical protein
MITPYDITGTREHISAKTTKEDYILSKTLMAKGDSPDLSLAMNCMALDVMFQNYLLFVQGDCKFIVVPDMEYDHVLHDGSYYLQTCQSINTRLFNSFYE